MMQLDPRYFNLAEAAIEQWLFENPTAIPGRHKEFSYIERWLARQYALPSGVADLIGVTESNKLVVVEVKASPITKSSILQVCRYAHDVVEIAGMLEGYEFLDPHHRAYLDKVVIGFEIDQQTLIEAEACEVMAICLVPSLQLHLTVQLFSREWIDERYDENSRISEGEEWDFLRQPRLAGPE